MHTDLRDDISSLIFIEELDRLKCVMRRSFLYDNSRLENSAEHSWHLATAVLASAELSNEPVDMARALKMALIHDVVEIDAGDTFVYDQHARADKQARENLAAQRLFGLLPAPRGPELRALWDGYERQACAESRFVSALDRFLPLNANFKTQGRSWKQHGVRKRQVVDVNCKIANGSRRLWAYAESLINEAVRLGYLADE